MSEKQLPNKDSFIFYRSFFEALSDLPDQNQLELFKAISNFSLNFIEPKLTGLSKTIFTLIQPQLLANKKRYENGCKGAEHGKKGGRNPKKTPKKPQKKPKKTPELTPNKNENENNNVNENENNNLLIPAFIAVENWNGFVSMRNEIRKPLSERAARIIIKKLITFESNKEGSANVALENSIESSWSGVFEPKVDRQNISRLGF